MFTVSKSYEVSIAHELKGHEICGTKHGHNIRITIEFQGRCLNKHGMVIDFHDIDKIAGPTIDLLDHSEIIPLVHPPDYRGEPTMENIARYIYGRVLQALHESVFELIEKYETIEESASLLPDLRSVSISETKNNIVKYWRS